MPENCNISSCYAQLWNVLAASCLKLTNRIEKQICLTNGVTIRKKDPPTYKKIDKLDNQLLEKSEFYR